MAEGWDMETPQLLYPSRPETFRLPKSGERDPYFGMARSFWYAAEAEGRIELVRVRSRGKARGVTLVPFAAARALILEENHS